MERIDKLEYRGALESLQACALAGSRLRPVAQRTLYRDLRITISTTLWGSNLPGLLQCFSTTRLAKYVRSISILADGYMVSEGTPVYINIPELQEVLSLVAGAHEYTTANGELVRQESPVTALELNEVRGTEEQIHDIVTMFPRLKTLELWSVECDASPSGDVVAFRGTEEVTTLHGDLTEFAWARSAVAIPFRRLFPDNLSVHLHTLRFYLDSDGTAPLWDELIRRAGASLQTLHIGFADGVKSIDMSHRTSIVSRVSRVVTLIDYLVTPDSQFDLEHQFEGDTCGLSVYH